ncbi:hypothetical protein EJB05_38026, partial [Eragrostis curvula]
MAGYFNASAEASEMCIELLRNIKSAQSNYQSLDSTNADPRQVLFHVPEHQIQSQEGGEEDQGREGNQEATEDWPCRGVWCDRGGRRRRCSAPALLRPYGRAGGSRAVPDHAQEADREEDEVQQDRVFTAAAEQLDTAAKGTYVLGNELDTVNQLVARLSDGIERENAMAQYCLGRENEGSSVPEMVRELKKSYSNSRRLALELEQHVCLCLATIDRARVLVIEEIFKKA